MVHVPSHVYYQRHDFMWKSGSKLLISFPSMQILMISSREECERVVWRVVFCLFMQENPRSEATVEALNVIIIYSSICILLKLSLLSKNMSLEISISLSFLNLDVLIRNGIHRQEAAAVSSLVIQLIVW